jgi:deoxyadenosine/deoxycytidine kinase
MQVRHIAVSGLIGAGKSTLVRGLSAKLKFAPLEERFEENPYLAGFYAEPSDWAFKSYVFFFQRTLDDYHQVERSDSGSVQERILEEHLVVFGEEFRARGYLEDSDLRLLRDLTRTSLDLVSRPDLLIYLDIDPAEALERIRHRANDVEGELPLDYLEALHHRYEDMLVEWEGEVLRLNAKEWDLRNAAEVSKLARQIRAISVDSSA